ncbi:putative C6 finger domain protein [Aspergillus clavatus NRRL 1]|uniref:C6 finger domain protein, putative n=1 Tax=Aspergillus clavatus (strain ATCC 1007 / CBS 513.65 / DSM 816 / NCTC 3887 / NRRL 1 / QM 1276 / 107) TaxID=344612 RepID=A1CSM1_ASPCL|nr:C6 finger domain protein, putative [Aspergillus clavatus NRRL 1]EAW06308.1 C6 finger domain protein, putative [Aspergillus clavatus NRRL 1]
MTVALNRPSIADPRQPGAAYRGYGPTFVEMIGTDDKPKSLPPYSGHPPPSMHHRMHPPDVAHSVPNAPGAYEASWRPYAPPFDHHHAEQRRTSAAPQPPLPSHPYPVIPNRELPQLPPEGPYGRPNGLPGPSHTPTEAHPPPPFRPMNGASHDANPHSAPPHSAPPHSAPPEYRSRMPFAPQEPSNNGDPPPPPHTMPPAQFPTPVPHISHTPAPYEPSFYQNQTFGMRQRKAARAQQACDQCRARKAKCDEGRPACSHCKENNLICVYKEVPPHKQEKATQQILDKIQLLEDKLDERLTHFQTVQIEHGIQLSRFYNEVGLKDTSRSVAPKPSLDRLLKPNTTDLVEEPKSGEAADPNDPSSNQSFVEREDGELSIPVEHTTAAHKLLSWPSIKNLLYPREYDEDYVMRLEEQRGMIRVYGRGEGDDSSETLIASAPLTSTSSGSGWDGTPIPRASPSSPWTQHSQPPAFQQKLQDKGVDEFGILWADPDAIRLYHRSYLEHIHRLHPFLDQNQLENKVESFVRLYCLPKTSTGAGDLPRGAKRKRSCETLQGAGCDVPTPTGVRTEGAGRRVEKSIDNAVLLLVLALGSICEVGEPVPGPATDFPPDYRKEWIPGPPTRNILSPAGSDAVLQNQTSFYAPVSNPHAVLSPSTIDGRRSTGARSASAGREVPPNKKPRNVDVIPGLSYYAYAIQIMGYLQGANGLLHVQAALLAGLYAGQLAHPFQSHGWIYQAARACQVLIRSKRYDQMQDGPMKDLYDFAYWTCLQLESDILAELDLPASGISRAEARIGLPKGRFTLALPNEICAPSTMMMFFYSAQIHLRKVLNRVHTDLYKVEKQAQGAHGTNAANNSSVAGSASAVNAAIAAITANASNSTTGSSMGGASNNGNRWTSNVQEILSMNLELWRNSLPEVMRWKDGDPPSKDINVARMRAKYYGARYIIHRPLLYHALHFAGLPDAALTSVDSPAGSVLSGPKSQQVSPSLTHSQRATNMARLSSDMGLAGHSAPPSFPAGSMGTIAYRDLPTKLRRACKVCIDSAILSTEAFDGVEGRPIVTNIFGTAHAQFGNMLVLSATYMSCLSELVDRTVLEKLLKRTIKFLLESRNISPTLRADARILTEIYEKIFGEPAASFSSAYS